MNFNKLKAKIVLDGWKISDFIEEAEIDKSRYYRIFRGEDEFNRLEIKKIIEVLNLTNTEAIDIFFTEKVS